jgi:hypothetical protein
MDDDRRTEIEALRRRVFGPDRDPADTAALDRLRELESAASDADGTVDPRSARHGAVAGSAERPDGDAAAADVDAGGVDAADGDTGDADAADGDASTRAATGSAPTRRARRARALRSVPALWVASVVVAALASAGLTAWLVDDDRGTVAVLELQRLPEPDNATYLSVDTGAIVPGTSVADFHGITVARIPGTPLPSGSAAGRARPEDGDAACLTVGASGQDGSVAGPSACGAGSAPARVPVLVTRDDPRELQDAFPAGTTLVFEVDGDAVRVRVGDR